MQRSVDTAMPHRPAPPPLGARLPGGPFPSRSADAASVSPWAARGAVPPLLPLSPSTLRIDDIGGAPSARGFQAMREAFRASGGMANGDDLGRLLEDRQVGDFITLARLIVSGAVFAVVWRNACWVPMFQFDLRDLSIREGPRQVLSELSGVCDDWNLAAWFVRANSWIDGRCPVEQLQSDLPGVLAAARADRHVVRA